jgi:hypothetical protein
MADEWALTCYCGLYCLDCIPSKKDLYETAAKLDSLLSSLQFEKYAALKAGQTYWSPANGAFKHYPQFIEVLKAIQGLECPVNCREGGGYKEGRCEVRNCAVEKKLAGCWECPDFRSCKLLEPLFKFHPNLLYHIELIKTEGVENWAKKRKGHYYWQ